MFPKTPHEDDSDRAWFLFQDAFLKLSTEMRQKVLLLMDKGQTARLFQLDPALDERLSMLPPPPKKCPDCFVALERIKLMDRRDNGESELTFADPDSKRSFWRGHTRERGIVAGWMCPRCRRIQLYGDTGAEEEQIDDPRRGQLSLKEPPKS